MGTEMAVPFANISIVEIKTKIIQHSKTEPRKWNDILITFSPFGIATGKR